MTVVKQTTLTLWKELMENHDLRLYNVYQRMTKKDLEATRQYWKDTRAFALRRLNETHEGQLLNIDVADDELYAYVEDSNKQRFFNSSRVLDFSMGFTYKGFVLVKKGHEKI